MKVPASSTPSAPSNDGKVRETVPVPVVVSCSATMPGHGTGEASGGGACNGGRLPVLGELLLLLMIGQVPDGSRRAPEVCPLLCVVLLGFGNCGLCPAASVVCPCAREPAECFGAASAYNFTMAGH